MTFWFGEKHFCIYNSTDSFIHDILSFLIMSMTSGIHIVDRGFVDNRLLMLSVSSIFF